MSFWRIVLKSLWRHRLSSLLAVVSIALGVALLVAVVSLREQTHRNFIQEGLSVWTRFSVPRVRRCRSR